MATVRAVNIAVPGPEQNADHYQMWRLTREMLNAGWVIVEASDGTTKTVGSGWTTLAESQNANSWCALARPGNTTWGHLFWFRNVSAFFGGATPSAFQYYTTSGWDTSATTASNPPVPADGQNRAYYKISGLEPPNYVSTAGARNWFAGKYALTMTHCNFVLIDDPAKNDYSIITWGYGTYNGSGAGQGKMPSFFAWSAVDGASDATTGNGDPYAFICHNESGEWDLGGDFANPFGPNAVRGMVPQLGLPPAFLFLERGTAACLNTPTPGQYIFTNTGYRDAWAAPGTCYLEPVFTITTSGTVPVYKGHMRWVRFGPTVVPDGGFYNVADEAGTYNWARTCSADMVVPWDGTTNQQQPIGVSTVFDATLMFKKTGNAAPAPTLPTITMTAPAANPCDPRANITVDYAYTGSGGTAVCTLSVFANGDTDRSALMYAGNPTTNAPAESAPTDFFEIVSESDDGTTGQKVLRPIAGKYYPIDVTTWTAIITTDVGTSASSSGSQNVDASLIPPVGDVTAPVVTILNPAPGGALPVNGAVAFTVTDDSGTFALIPVWVKLPNGTVELIHDGTAFTAPYNGLSSLSAVALGYSYSARRNQGWPDGVVRIIVRPIDSSGNVT